MRRPEEVQPKTAQPEHGTDSAPAKASEASGELRRAEDAKPKTPEREPPAPPAAAQARAAQKPPDSPPTTPDAGQKMPQREPKIEDVPVLAAPLPVPPDPPASPRTPEPALAALLRVPASEIMEKDVVWANPEDTVQDVIAKMQQHNVGYVLVGRNGVLEGLVSSSNILGAVSLYLRPMFAKWRRPEDDATLGVKVKWIMSRPVRTVRPDATLAVLIESMRRCGGGVSRWSMPAGPCRASSPCSTFCCGFWQADKRLLPGRAGRRRPRPCCFECRARGTSCDTMETMEK